MFWLVSKNVMLYNREKYRQNQTKSRNFMEVWFSNGLHCTLHIDILQNIYYAILLETVDNVS